MDEETTARAKRGKDCPSDAALAAYAAGGTSVGSDLFDHLATCAACRQYVAKRVVGAPVDEGSLLGGRYRIEHLLATGGIGAIVRAVDTKLDRHVAIKMVLSHVENDANIRARFDLEAKVANKMRSEHVAHVLDIGEENGRTQYIVYEYLTGEDLAALLARRGPLGVEETCKHVLQACEAIAEAHSLGIIHRDLKPANLFLTRRPDGSSCIKVIDFGIAKTTSYDRDGLVSRVMLTHDKIVGTPGYMSPEQIRSSSDVDTRTDVWGMGVILYELLTGRPAFDGDNVNDIFAKILHQTPQPPSELRPELPAELAVAITRCLARDPERRLSTIADVARAVAPFAPAHAKVYAERVERLVRGSNVDSKADTGRMPTVRAKGTDSTAAAPNDKVGASSTTPTPVPAPRRRWPVMVLAAVTAVAVAAAVIATISRVRGSSPAIAIGTPCDNDGVCEDLLCRDGACTRACTRAADCPSPARCTVDGFCSVPLKVGFIYIGVPEDEGWTRTHDIGRKYVASKLPSIETDYVTNVYKPDDIARAVAGFVARGFSVIIANSSSFGEPLVALAKQYPDVRFIVVMSESPGPGVGAINARMYQGWYLAGYAAAQYSKTHRLGYVGSLETPEVVRDINAFTRGARAFDPTIVVEVRWLGFWFDAERPDAQGRHKEERLTLELLAAGADVIANHADNGRVVAAVERAGNAASIGNNNIDACERGPTTCIGVPYWNWGPLYAEQLDAVRRGQFTAGVVRWERVRANPDTSVINFRLNPRVAGDAIALETATLRAELAKDNGDARVFAGPYCSTGQRAQCVDANQSLGDDELRSMCWFVEGVVEKTDPADPKSADRPGRVSAECAKRR